MEPLITFAAQAQEVPPHTLHPVILHAPDGPTPGIEVVDGTLMFRVGGWYEILLTVGWDPTLTAGTRFAHTAIPDHHPLHSEAINAAVLAALSDGKQLLRGNTTFEPDTIDRVALEVWHDNSTPVRIHEASLAVRRLGP
jgi:hypothetical protein